MDPLAAVAIALFLLVGLGGAAVLGAVERDRVAAWRGVLESQGAKNIVSSTFLNGAMSGEVGRLRVRMERYSRDESENGTRLSVSGARIPPGVAIRTEGVTPSAVRQRTAGTEIEIGDQPFDDAFSIGGPPAYAYALLDAETRRLLLSRLHVFGPVEIRNGALVVDIRDGGGHVGSATLTRALADLLESAHRLSARRSVAERLGDNAVQDPQPLVRLRNLTVLLREFPDHATTGPAISAGCVDPHPAIRLCAALGARPERLDIVLEIIGGDSVDDTTAATAIYELGPRLTVGQALATLEGALRLRRLGVAHACVERLGASGDPAMVTTLAKILAIEQGELGEHAARALGALGVAEAERPLLAALGRSLGVRKAAAEALARCGTVAAVLPLKEAAEADGERDFSRAARQAIGAIQSRLSGVAPGQLSLTATAGEAGQLSFPQKDGGEVSLVDPKADRGA